jgi:outer membrane protein assembly factor BamE
MNYRLLLMVLLGAFLTSCQTHMIEEFNKVRPGMDKGQVLEIIGSPQTSDRWKGKDRWQYVYYKENRKVVKEILFDNGKADYVGDEYKYNKNAKTEELNNSIKNLTDPQ